MRWWTHLYMGENASRNRVSILEGLRKGKMLVDTYVITLPESGNHILDILPVSLLTRQQRDGKDFLVLGIARGYEEAAQVVRSMVDDMYQKTGAFNWKAYMESLPEKSGAEYGDWQEQ